ncbi:hypothetical protein IV203_009251 [Nitzschia inconspicua]|uniref:Rubredoxin-like domain-containing protein n=1 Tax=Nitzschia inconspicua TaxID=303405 RepID=A0A9K3K8N1_9STRA|nr:hypothetical protein IV203_011060 [Nitzschia inconspicua]KAG7353202.1 hypothetical protein IV203_009251 [Nitzschia inconspicua]
MRISLQSAPLLAILINVTDAFRPSFRSMMTPSISSLKSSRPNLHEFDHLFDEGALQSVESSNSGIHIRVPLRPGERAVILASTTAVAAPGFESESMEASAVDQEFDPYGDLTIQEQDTLKRYEVQGQQSSFSQNLENRLKQMDFQDVISTLILPAIFGGFAVKWGIQRVASQVSAKTDDTLDKFATEMIYHDGDFEEMKLCFQDYSKKLSYLGPKKTSAMLKRYLESYAKKKTVSPQSISSLSYVFSLFKLSEEQAAQILVSLCKDMGDTKISSAGKILFFGSRILKSPEGKAALVPIRDMIKATYREASVAETMVETSQQAMAEAAYKSAVLAAGKDQQTLTIGWEVLGLDKETATRIFEEEAKDGFVSDREKMYGGQSRKYDKKGNAIDKEGNLVDPANAVEGSDGDDEPTSNVFECSDCGYTLFVAKGRESKFYGEGFKCPECGAAKDKFKPKDIEED